MLSTTLPVTDSLQSPISNRKTSQPARIVFLLQDLEFGGTQRQIIELASRLNPSKFQTEIWLLISRDDMVPWARAKGLTPVWISRQAQVRPVIDQINLWRRLHEKPIDLLMLLTGVPNIWGRILGHLPRIPLIVGTCRGENNLRLQFEDWLWPLADHIICNSSLLKDLYLARYNIPSSRISVIPNGVDADYFQPSFINKKSGSFIVLCIARMVPDKDHQTLLHSFRLIASSYSQAELWLVGEGCCQKEIRALAAELFPPGKIKFIPGETDIRPLLNQADLLVLSSVNEGMPNVILEAMAAGLPVVATRVGGLAEVVIPGRTGWLVPPRDVTVLAAAISHLLGNRETRLAFGLAGRQLIERQFSMDTMVAKYQALFENLLMYA